MPRNYFLRGGFLFLILVALMGWFFWPKMSIECNIGFDAEVYAGVRGCIAFERASSQSSREKGLSGRENMPHDAGMLFVFEQNATQCIWMKDMQFNLDIIWLDETKKIVKIEKDVSPSTYPQSFCATAQYVIEVNSGIADSADLQIGQRIKL